MTDDSSFAARLITLSSTGYAAAAANRLLDEHPDTAGRFGDGAFHDWQAHLKQRLDELAAALLAQDPNLFVSEVTWSAAAFRAREVPVSDLKASLECLRDALGEELPEEAAELPRQYLELSLKALEEDSDPAEPKLRADSETHRLGLVYLEALLSGERRKGLDAILEAVDGGLEISAAFEALAYAQQQVGEMWHAHQLGVAQEHFVTETTRSAVTLLTQRAERKEPNGKTVLVASAPGNFHDMGGRFVAAYFEMEGWRTIHLAEPMPAEEVALGVDLFAADLLALSMSLATQLKGTLALVARARDERPGIKILLGGRSLVQSPQLSERIGADAWAETAADAVRQGARLVGLTEA